MAQITIGRVQLLSGPQAEQEVRAWQTSLERISPQAAATIAAWFQSPAPIGRVFASLSSAGEVDAEELAEACDYEMRDTGYNNATRLALAALKQFAQSYQ